MSALPGRALDGPFAYTVPLKSRPGFLSQMAGYIAQLGGITFPSIGRIWAGDKLDQEPQIIPLSTGNNEMGPFNSSTAYFRGLQRVIDDFMADSLGVDHDDGPEWRRYSRICNQAIKFFVYPELLRGPFPLWHRDFHFKNILVDDDYNITGVLDWTDARTAPWETFVLYGDILHDGAPDGVDKPITEFRADLVDALRKIEEDGQPERRGPLICEIISSGVVDLIDAWLKDGIPRSGEAASETALRVLRLLFGEETTFENYRAHSQQPSKQPAWRRRVD